jgi:hypothetical protein
MRLWVYSGRPSEGAAYLAAEDGFKRSRTGHYIKHGDVVVNWGTTRHIPGSPVAKKVLNKPDCVTKAINKRTTFQILAGANVSVVPWTANKAIAKEWLDNGYVVVVRKTLTGHEGSGIVIVEQVQDLIDAPLYTRYIDKVREFRVHATQFGVIDTQWKVRDPQREVISWKVRSYKNGFIFQRKGVNPNAHRDALAIQAVKALGLDFGGLDIIEDKQGNFYVVEVNTAPGIEGTTVGRYAAALKQLAAHFVHGTPIPYGHKEPPANGVGPNPGQVPKPAPHYGHAAPVGAVNLNGPAGPGLWPVAPAVKGTVNLNAKWG